MPETPRRPWRIMLPLFVMIALGIIWSIYWYVASSIVQQRVALERAKLADRGLALDCTQESWVGYPFRFEFACTSPVVRFGTRLEARSGNLIAVALAYYPWQVAFLIDGPSTLTGNSGVPHTATHQRVLASVTIGQGNRPSLSVDVLKLAVQNIGTLDRLRLDSRPAAGITWEVSSTLETLNYEPTGRPALQLDHASLRGFLSMERELKIDHFDASRASVKLWGQGELSLDGNRRPAGKLSTETNDLDGVLKIAEPYLKLTEQQKSGLRAILGLIGSSMKADIIAQDGQLFVGPFKVANLRALY